MSVLATLENILMLHYHFMEENITIFGNLDVTRPRHQPALKRNVKINHKFKYYLN